jgi:hypothetical protein
MKLICNIGRRKNKRGGNYQTFGLFQCDFCGEKVERNLGNGKKNKSCGCSRIKHITKHGMRSSVGFTHPLYIVWSNLKRRCYKPKQTKYQYYGGRGIKVCDEWKNSFKEFFDWATKNGWNDGLQIDRKDNNGDYCPTNCRFVKPIINIQNSSIAKLTTKEVSFIRSKYKATDSYKKIGEIYNVSGATISNILNHRTWKNIK